VGGGGAGGDWQASGLLCRSLAGSKRGRAVGRGLTRGKGGERGSGCVPRLLDGTGRTCEREVAGIAGPTGAGAARAGKRRASHGESGEGGAGFASKRYRGAQACKQGEGNCAVMRRGEREREWSASGACVSFPRECCVSTLAIFSFLVSCSELTRSAAGELLTGSTSPQPPSRIQVDDNVRGRRNPTA